MTIFCYGRVSTSDQDTALQRDELQTKYPDCVYREEKASGTNTKGRPVLRLILDMVKAGDKLVVWKLDRLARNMNDLCQIVESLQEKGASLEILNQSIDTSSPSGRAFIQMLGIFAEFETNLRRERQLAGIKAAKAKGKHCGRKSTLTPDQQQEIRKKSSAGATPTDLAKEYGVSRGTVYNILKKG